MSSRAFRPAFNCIRDRQVWTASARSGTKRDSQRLSRFGMILCEILNNAHRAILHVSHGNCSRRWLRVHKVTHIVKLGSETRVRCIVDQHEQLQRGLVPLQGNPFCHLKAVTASKTLTSSRFTTGISLPCLASTETTVLTGTVPEVDCCADQDDLAQLN